MRVAVITLFPEILDSLNYGMPGRAQAKGLLELSCINPRDFTDDAYQSVDDSPYGGGPGMVLKAEPLLQAVVVAQNRLQKPARVIYLSPQGRKLNHAGVVELSNCENLILLAGRYEGIDQRVIDSVVDEQWSIGDYVLSGGEFAACVMIDTITRLLPGVLGAAESAEQDSFVSGLLDYPHYTRPEVVKDLKVPEILLSGNHTAIAKWRLQQSLGATWRYRPDLLEQYILTDEERILLHDFIKGEEDE